MRRYFFRSLVLIVSMVFLAPARSQPLPQPEAQAEIPPAPQPLPKSNVTPEKGFRIEFLGKEPSSDWARVAGKLVDEKLVPIETLQITKGHDACSAVLEQLNFRSRAIRLRCSDDMRTLIKRMNPGLPNPLPIGTEVKYPDLPLEATYWYAGFDRSLPGEADRYRKISQAWKAFKFKHEETNGSLVQVKFRGFSTEIVPSDPAEAAKALGGIERYDPKLRTFDTRVLTLSSASPQKPFSMTMDPITAGDLCLRRTPPPAPLPSYVVLLNGSEEHLRCESKCKAKELNRCPEIVLLDQPVSRHPDIASSLRPSDDPPDDAAGGGTPNERRVAEDWCPFLNFNVGKHHGTHLAGIMVGSRTTKGFPGLAPNASLDDRNIQGSFEREISKLIKAKNFFNHRGNVIFVYASQFPNAGITLSNNDDRLASPPYVRDLLDGLRLWVVAAGQVPSNQPPFEIAPTVNMSPMNLGDQNTVLVVTACDDCYSDRPTIARWANYSGPRTGGLVNLAAPGGSDARKIPSTVTESQHGLSFGTSQATALVGGLAAAMMSCHPSYTAQSLKTRLLATSRPWFNRNSDVAKKISAGIVDASTALLSPHVHWITRRVNGKLDDAKELKWCQEEVKVRRPDNTNETISTKEILRLVRSTSSGEADSWFVFHQDQNGIVKGGVLEADRSKPLLFLRQEGPQAKAQIPLKLDEIEDFLVGLAPDATSEVPRKLKGCSL
jgi:hypothetical protein